MEVNYFRDIIELYDQSGIKKNILLYNSAYKYTDLCIWELDGRLNFSNGFDFIYTAKCVLDYNEAHNCEREMPMLIYDTSNYKIMYKILSIVENEEYRGALEKLDQIIKTNELSLVKEI